jgi:hypothetical protein
MPLGTPVGLRSTNTNTIAANATPAITSTNTNTIAANATPTITNTNTSTVQFCFWQLPQTGSRHIMCRYNL